jgi:uncharacterized protein (TIGR03086 family)
MILPLARRHTDDGPDDRTEEEAMTDISDHYRRIAGQFSARVDAADMICTGDEFQHTWDLARATGLDETLDPDEVHRLYESMEPVDELLRNSGHFGPRVAVPDDADEQTKLIAFTGRQP